MKRDSFVFYTQWADAIKVLPDNDRLTTLEAIISYATTGTTPDDITPAALAIVNLVKDDIDYDTTKKEVMREVRRQAGMKGMAARWGKANKGEGQTKDTNE